MYIGKEVRIMEYDVIIIGGGPAGLTAGLYCARGGMKSLLIEMGMPGGQAANTDLIENYPGFPQGVSGIELMQKFMEHALNFGLEIKMAVAQSLDLKANPKKIITSEGTFLAKTVIIASGAVPRPLNVPGEERFRGVGVSYCAVCDGAFFRDKKVVVVGGGDSALEEANYLTKFAKEVVIIHRRDAFRAINVYQNRVKANPKISFLLDTVVEEIKGESKVEKVVVKNVKSGEIKEVATDGVFIFVGTVPNTDYLQGQITLDDRGYVVTNAELGCSIPGVFAAGDVRQKTLRQVSTAVGDGAVAAMSAERYIAEKLTT
ncbi:MAG: thioredoxin-disulfide reductase [Zhaonellaceae bacterium]|jgi:thioredoxin reductase (NADPH)|nr:thioredoxin-disulfide reductase [Clostridia bacterium]